MRPVNLLPKELARPGARRPSAALVAAAAAAPIVAGCLVFAGYTLEHSTVRDRQGKLTAVERQLASRPGHPAARPDGSALASEREARQAALQAVLLDRLPWDETLVDLSRVIPGDVWLTSLELTSPTPADATASATGSGSSSDGFSIEGDTHTQDAVAQLLQRLQLLPMLSQVTLGQTSASTGPGPSLVQFSITAAIAPPESGGAT